MKQAFSSETGVSTPPGNLKDRILPAAAWVLALALIAAAVWGGLRQAQGLPLLPERIGMTAAGGARPIVVPPAAGGAWPISVPPAAAADLDLPQVGGPISQTAVLRRPELHTTIPRRSRQDVITYTVEKGDSLFEIARSFKLAPETVLWSNYDQLNDNPDQLAVGMDLVIPPVDGVLYNWQPGDTLDGVAAQLKTSAAEIINWPGNAFDLADPQVEPGALVMVPDGRREFRQWVIPTIPRGSAGVAASIYGAGACEGGYEGAYGTGSFIWPANTRDISGNDYWDGHLAIDIGAGEGQPIFAADSGVVVFAGWTNDGYGNMVMIDHGNGYQTLYAHLSSVTARCGQSVTQGGTIGLSGSTGNSTGAHLHFEVRYQGGFVSPWFVLP